MRFYKIKMSDQDGKPVTPSSLSTSGPAALIGSGTAPATEPGVITSLLSDGTTNPGALDVEIQVDQMTEAIGDFRSFVRIFGLGIRDISHGFDLNPSLDGKRYTNIEISVGMAKGLPLADPSQQGTILSGTIWQAFGNWLGTEMTLDLVVGPGGLTGKPEQPKSYVFTWTKGQKLADAISNTIQNNPVLSKLKTSLTVSDDRVANEDKSGYYVTATEFAQLIQNMTVRQRGDTDQGVQLYITPQAVIAGEIGGSPQQGQSVKQIKFEDLLGQITWIEPLKLTAKVVMRGDLNLLDYIKFPPNAITQTTATALPSVAPSQRESDSLGIASGGSFQVIQMHHYGRYRQPDAMSWNTTLVLTPSQNAV